MFLGWAFQVSLAQDLSKIRAKSPMTGTLNACIEKHRFSLSISRRLGLQVENDASDMVATEK